MTRGGRKLHVVTGKGGVGKSTVAAAIALALAARGQRVLAIELGGPGGLARILGAAAPSIDITGTGAAALAEYLTRKVRLGRFRGRLLAHPLYRAFAGAAPGVRELLAMGKVRDELVLQDRWDAVVVDAGASGHALEHLRMPAAAARAFGAGLVHREAAVNAALLRDRAVCRVHVVATPEEMPVREALQVIGTLATLDVPLGAVIVNQCRPVAPDGVDAAIARLDGELAATARRARGWEQIQE
ncbi:MAG: P-loop NTPase, partial [Deltaproteobacteria bacterium]|nr:P-loop NTPase [Kofleriaceae bacterium]